MQGLWGAGLYIPLCPTNPPNLKPDLVISRPKALKGKIRGLLGPLRLAVRNLTLQFQDALVLDRAYGSDSRFRA